MAHPGSSNYPFTRWVLVQATNQRVFRFVPLDERGERIGEVVRIACRVLCAKPF